MALGQQEPVISSVLHKSPTRLDQPLLQARQGPVPDSPGEHHLSPQVADIIGNDTQPQPHLVGPEPMATEARRLHRLLAFFDLLLGCPTLIIEPVHRPARQGQVGHNEPNSGEQLHRMMLDPRRRSSARLAQA